MFFHMLLASIDPNNEKYRHSSDKLTIYVAVIILIVAVYPSFMAHFSPRARRNRRSHSSNPVSDAVVLHSEGSPSGIIQSSTQQEANENRTLTPVTNS